MPVAMETRLVDGVNEGAAAGFTRIGATANPTVNHIPVDGLRPTEYHIFLYSVSKRKMADSTLAFVVENAAMKTVAIPACKQDERFVKVMAIAHPVQTLEADPNNLGETVVRIDRARYVAMSICNPDVVALSMDHLPPASSLAKYSISGGCDLIKQGVFFCEWDSEDPAQYPKFEKYLKMAEERRDIYYRQCLDGLMGMSEDQVRFVMNQDQRGIDVRTAAEHFGEDVPGLRARTIKVGCINCGEKIPQGAAFHKSEALGVICVLDWRRAVDAGVKTLAEVPLAKRWVEGGLPITNVDDPNLGHGQLSEEDQILATATNPELIAHAKAVYNLELKSTLNKAQILAAIDEARSSQ